MKTYELNLKFESEKACREWEKENLTVNGRQMYNGEYIMMVMYDEAEDDGIVLTEIWTC